jgi:hypothetical protein
MDDVQKHKICIEENVSSFKFPFRSESINLIIHEGLPAHLRCFLKRNTLNEEMSWANIVDKTASILYQMYFSLKSYGFRDNWKHERTSLN